MAYNFNNKKCSIALSAGGVLLISALPLVRFLLEHPKIDVQRIAGVSGGALIAALILIGKSDEEILEFYQDAKLVFNWAFIFREFFNISNTEKEGFFKVEKMHQRCHDMFDDWNFEDLSPELIVVATDFETGVPVYATSGPITEPIIGSCSLYPLFPPVEYGTQWLIDGAYSMYKPLQALPTDTNTEVISIFCEPERIHSIQSSTCLRSNFTNVIFNSLLHLSYTRALAYTIFNDENIHFIKIHVDKYVDTFDSKKVYYLYEYGTKFLKENQELVEDILYLNPTCP